MFIISITIESPSEESEKYGPQCSHQTKFFQTHVTLTVNIRDDVGDQNLTVVRIVSSDIFNDDFQLNLLPSYIEQ